MNNRFFKLHQSSDHNHEQSSFQSNQIQNLHYQNNLRAIPKIYGRKKINRINNQKISPTNHQKNIILSRPCCQNRNNIQHLIFQYIKPLKHIRISSDLASKKRINTQVTSSTNRVITKKSSKLSPRYFSIEENRNDPGYLNSRVLEQLYSSPTKNYLKQQNNLISNRQKSLIPAQTQINHKVFQQKVNHLLLPPISDNQSEKKIKVNHLNKSRAKINKGLQQKNKKIIFNKHHFQIQEQQQDDYQQSSYQTRSNLRISNQNPVHNIQKKDNATQIDIKSYDAKQVSSCFHEKTYFGELSQKQSHQKLRLSTVKSIHSINTLAVYKIPSRQQLPKFIENYKGMNQKFDLKKISESQNFKIIKFVNGIYMGQAKQNQRHGFGLFISQKSIFQGQFNYNLKKKGIESTKQGIYLGQFFNGLRHGKGEFRWINNQIYIGQWKNGLKNGRGIWKSPNGNYYDGQWVNNKQQGFGIHIHQGSIYKGQFQNFLKHGEGQQKFLNEDIYKGQYVNGKPNGCGQYIWKNGKKYNGQFKDGLRHGQGIIQQDGNIYKVVQVNLKMIQKTVQVKFDLKMEEYLEEYLEIMRLLLTDNILTRMVKRLQYEYKNIMIFSRTKSLIQQLNQYILIQKFCKIHLFFSINFFFINTSFLVQQNLIKSIFVKKIDIDEYLYIFEDHLQIIKYIVIILKMYTPQQNVRNYKINSQFRDTKSKLAPLSVENSKRNSIQNRPIYYKKPYQHLRQSYDNKNQNAKLYNYNYTPMWRKESILQQLNKSLNTKNLIPKPEDLPKPVWAGEQNQDYLEQKKNFFALIRKVPLQRRTRTEQNMNQFMKELPKSNFFFKSFSLVFNCSLFKIGKIRFFQQTDIVYQKKNESSQFYIILWGKVKMSDKKEAFKKISRRGETLSQEILFTNLKFKQQKVTALEECYMLEIQHKLFQRFYQTMISNGMKNEVFLMEKNIKRNFLAKNTMRATKLE